MERRAKWDLLGLNSGSGRGTHGTKGVDAGLTFALSAASPHTYAAKDAYSSALGREVSWEEFAAACPELLSNIGDSVFDPVVAELAYRWFCPPRGEVLDPFCGGSVRGFVAGVLGMRYTGIDLSLQQIAANEQQLNELQAHLQARPTYVHGDSNVVLADPRECDLVFSCPPYGNLEVYSDDKADISNMPHADFERAYRSVILRACAGLRDNRFAVWVVGDYRDKKSGLLRDFVSMSIDAFAQAGLSLYNEAIIIDPASSAATRAPRQFVGGRKLTRTHQQFLVFVKGRWKDAVKACGDCVVSDLESVDVADEVGS